MRHHLLPLLLPLSVASGQTTVSSVNDAFAQGQISLNARLRYEHAEQTGLTDSDALTLRTRLGFTTAPWNGFKLLLEAEDVTAADGDRYNQGGLNVPGPGSGRVVIADPEGTEVNQAFVNYTSEQLAVTAGRQRLVLDNARFIGDVGWRQDQQTFDAVTVGTEPLEALQLTYGYLWQINRIFAEAMDWDSDSHILNAKFTTAGAGTLTGYAYLLDFDSAPVNSTATYGLSWAGTRPLSGGASLSYRAEYARQSDYRSSPLHYEADYYLLEAGGTLAPFTAKVGYEVLGSDHGIGFRTPLATLHAFNGWADVFLTTPAAGLDDLYVSLAATPRTGLNLAAVYHWFNADSGGADYGRELDLLASYTLTPRLTVLGKFAFFDSEHAAFRSTDRYTVELTFAY